jgi:HD superfamily phosphohydrolase
MESVAEGDHETRSAAIVRNGPVSDLLSDIGLDPVNIADVISGTSALSTLLASEIDIDRIDYLQRDAHYTGVSSALDAGRLSTVMEFEDHRLIFRESGLAAVEALLLARFMMYPYVYFHHTARIAERMMARALEALMGDGLDEAELWAMDDVDLLARLRGSPGLPGMFMSAIDERRLFKRGWEVSLSQLLRKLEPGQYSGEMIELLKRHLTRERRLSIEHHIASVLDLDPELVLFDCPLPPELDTRNIMVRRRNGEIVSARALSQMVSVLENAQLDHWKFRVFLPAEHRYRMNENLMDSITSYLGTELEPITLGNFFSMD